MGRRHFDRTLYGPGHPRANCYIIDEQFRISLVESLGADTAYLRINALNAPRGNGYDGMQEVLVRQGPPTELNSLYVPHRGHVQLVDIFEVEDGITPAGFPRRTDAGIVKVRFKPNEHRKFEVQEKHYSFGMIEK